MTAADILAQLQEKADAQYHAGMLRFGVDNTKALGVRLPELRKIAKSFKKDHQLALDLWVTGIHEARICASLVDDPKMVTPQQMDSWVKDFYSWDLCDQVCGNLFDRTPFAIQKALEYSKHESEYIKRAGFVLMAEYAVHNKKADDQVFIDLMPIIVRQAWDDRNFVRKAVNWALRQIGKRNSTLRSISIQTANIILQQNTKSARWIATNALKELV